MVTTRRAFHQQFASAGTAIFPVIHVLDNAQASRNVDIALQAGVAGVFLINHDFAVAPFVPIVRHVRSRFEHAWIGVNFLAVTGLDAFPVLGDLAREGCVIDAYWADDARIDERIGAGEQVEAADIANVRQDCGWTGMYFGGTAFKKQRPVASDDYVQSARLASAWMDVVTTSGMATGKAADRDKIVDFRRGCGDCPLAVASGITPDNAVDYLEHVDAFLVATGINYDNDFYNIDPQRLRALIEVCQSARN